MKFCDLSLILCEQVSYWFIVNSVSCIYIVCYVRICSICEWRDMSLFQSYHFSYVKVMMVFVTGILYQILFFNDVFPWSKSFVECWPKICGGHYYYLIVYLNYTESKKKKKPVLRAKRFQKAVVFFFSYFLPKLTKKKA